MDNGEILAMMQNQNFMNNPLAWLVFLEVFQNGGWNNGNGHVATPDDVSDAQWKTGVDSKLVSLGNGLADSGYANAQLINGVEKSMLQGFNGLQAAVTTGFMGQTQQINNLENKLQECCCSLKTQMLQDKYDAVVQENGRLYTNASNADQTQYLLNQLGRYVSNPPTPPAGLLASGTTF